MPQILTKLHTCNFIKPDHTTPAKAENIWLVLGEGIAFLQLTGAALIITGLYTTRRAKAAVGRGISS